MTLSWFKIFRKIIFWKHFKRDGYVRVWIYLLAKAHYGNEPVFDAYGNEINKGQLTTGREQIGKFCGVNPSKVQRILKTLENEHRIEQRNLGKCRLITITKWESYQSNEHQDEHQVNISRTTSEHTIRNKRNKEYIYPEKKPEKKKKPYPESNIHESFIPLLDNEMKKYFIEKLKPSKEVQEKWLKCDTPSVIVSEMEKQKCWCESKGKTYKNYSSAFSNWLKSDYRKKPEQTESPQFIF